MNSLLSFLLIAVPCFAEAPPELSAHQESLLPEAVAKHLDLLNDDALKAIASNLPVGEGAEVGAAARSWRKLALPSIERSLVGYQLWRAKTAAAPQGEKLKQLRGFLKADLLKGLGESPPRETAGKKVDERPVQAPAALEVRPVPEVQAVPEAPKPKPEWRRMLDELMPFIPK